MTKGLLLRQERDVVLASVIGQFFNLGRSQGRFFRRNQRLGLEIENVFHVEPEQVDLVLGQRANLHLQVINRREWAAADVVAHSPPFHARPITDGEGRDDQLFVWCGHSCPRSEDGNVCARSSLFSKQLAQGLHSVEKSLRAATGDDHAGAAHADNITLAAKVVSTFYSLGFKISPQTAVGQPSK